MRLTRTQKRFVLVIADVMLIYVSGFIANFFLSKELMIMGVEKFYSLATISFIYLISATWMKVFSTINRYTDYRTLSKIVLSFIISYTLVYLFDQFIVANFGVRFVLLSCVFSILLTIVSRLTWRMIYEVELTSFRSRQEALSSTKRVLVVGAGDGANLFIKTVLQDSQDFNIVGIVDADKSKLGTFLHGIKVIGLDTDIPEIVTNYEIEQIVIAIPSLKPAEYELLLDICKQTSAKVHSMPSYEEVIKGNLTVNKLRNIDIADLLGRDEVKLDQSSLQNNIKGKTILVTGAGGSIGSELCRQLCKFHPQRLLLLGHGENSIYLIHKELSSLYGTSIDLRPIIADIQDRDRIFEIMSLYKPDRVYHAAAHKHVPMMEENPREAIKNNILGTKNVAEAAKTFAVDKFVMISTDKAVNPPNIMGATKRIAEMIVTSLNGETGTLFAAVRFGNVLGSRGSVVPLFKEQIATGGPITVTDFRMVRYFMTIPEASRLVLQAGALMQGGEVFVLDMGEPVKILDLAKKVISLSGYTEEEIGIVESGIRPGEKLYEELLSSSEKVDEQVYEKIFVGKVDTYSLDSVEAFVDSLADLNTQEMRRELLKFAQQ